MIDRETGKWLLAVDGVEPAEDSPRWQTLLADFLYRLLLDVPARIAEAVLTREREWRQ